MTRINILAFKILFLSSVVHAEVAFAPSGSVPVFRLSMNSLASVRSGVLDCLVPSALLYKFRQLFQKGAQQETEIKKEANRREKGVDIILKREKSYVELRDERDRRIKELKEKIFNTNSGSILQKNELSKQEIWQELYDLQTKPLVAESENDDQLVSVVASDLNPDILEQPVKIGSWFSPQGWVAPVVGVESTEPVGDVPEDFNCPITSEVMQEPVIAADGFSYERVAIQRWIDQNRAGGRVNSPKTNVPLAHLNLTPNLTLRNMIRDSRIRRIKASEAASASASSEPVCVRTLACAAVKPDQDIELKDVTGLEWELTRRETRKMSFQQALDYAVSRAAEGWRLPTIWELYTLYRQKNVLGDGLDSDWFWSDTPFFRRQDLIWNLNFVDGNLNYYGHYNGHHVLLVRSNF
ncbi:MAG: U-box domain-containing protein [Myxococcaceae bacterium]